MGREFSWEVLLGSIGAIIGFFSGRTKVISELKDNLGTEEFESLDWVDIWIGTSANLVVLNFIIL